MRVESLKALTHAEGDVDGASSTGAVHNFMQTRLQDAEINVFWGSVQQFVAELNQRLDGSCR